MWSITVTYHPTHRVQIWLSYVKCDRDMSAIHCHWAHRVQRWFSYDRDMSSTEQCPNHDKLFTQPPPPLRVTRAELAKLSGGCRWWWLGAGKGGGGHCCCGILGQPTHSCFSQSLVVQHTLSVCQESKLSDYSETMSVHRAGTPASVKRKTEPKWIHGNGVSVGLHFRPTPPSLPSFGRRQ